MLNRFFFLCMISLVFPGLGNAQVCPENGAVDIYFGNGVLTDFTSAVRNTEILGIKSRANLPQSHRYRFYTSYNRNEDWFDQAIQVFKQKGEELISMILWSKDQSGAPDWFKELYREIQNQYQDLVFATDLDALQQLVDYKMSLMRSHKVVVVAHSQGNFYANYAYRRLNSESFGIVAVAPPTSRVGGDGPYITLFYDLVVNAVRALFPETLPGRFRNQNISLDPSGHYFVESYLDGDSTGPAIFLNITKQIEKLVQPSCIAAPPPLPPCDEVWCYDALGNPVASAASMGDPHLRSFDGLRYDFQGAGEYVYVRSQSGDLEIQGRLEPYTANVSRNSAIAAQVKDVRLGFYLSQEGISVLVDGKIPEFERNGLELAQGGQLFRSSRAPFSYTTVWPNGSQMQLKRRGPYLELELNLATEMKGKVMGLLGNFDGEVKNDLILPSGEVLPSEDITFQELYHRFGDSWRVTQESTLFDYFGHDTLASFVDRNFPAFPVDLTTVEKDLGTLAIADAKAMCMPLRSHEGFADCVLDTALVGPVENLDGYFNVATSKARLNIALPPRVVIEAPSPGFSSKGNVLVRGHIERVGDVLALLVRVNDSKVVDFTKSLQGPGFSLTLPNESLREGGNTAYILVEDRKGNRTHARLDFVINKDAAPPEGSDLIVSNDLNIFVDQYIQAESNIQFVKNLVNFSAAGTPKAGASKVVFSFGHQSRCDSGCQKAFKIMRQTLEEEASAVEDIFPKAGSLAFIADAVKVLFLWTPMVPYTKEEIRVLKKFAADGGRIVFIGENEGWYDKGIAVENDFLKAMGAQLENKGGTVLSGETSLIPTKGMVHQVLQGVSSIRGNLVSTIGLGPYDSPLFSDKTGQYTVVAVAQINVNPNPTRFREWEAYKSAPFARAHHESIESVMN